MKNRKIKISLITIISILILYFICSILFARNGQFVKYDFPSQLSIENSVYNKNFIREVRPQRIVIVDTVAYEKIKGKLEIYLCEAYYYKSYGILHLLKHRVDFENSVCLNVNYLGEEPIFIQYDDDRVKRMGSSNSFWNIFNLGSNVTVRIFNENEKEIVVMNFLNLTK